MVRRVEKHSYLKDFEIYTKDTIMATGKQILHFVPPEYTIYLFFITESSFQFNQIFNTLNVNIEVPTVTNTHAHRPYDHKNTAWK